MSSCNREKKSVGCWIYSKFNKKIALNVCVSAFWSHNACGSIFSFTEEFDLWRLCYLTFPNHSWIYFFVLVPFVGIYFIHFKSSLALVSGNHISAHVGEGSRPGWTPYKDTSLNQSYSCSSSFYLVKCGCFLCSDTVKKHPSSYTVERNTCSFVLTLCFAIKQVKQWRLLKMDVLHKKVKYLPNCCI